MIEIKLEPETEYTIELTLKGETLVTFVKALGVLPYNKVSDAIISITEQLKNQTDERTDKGGK